MIDVLDRMLGRLNDFMLGAFAATIGLIALLIPLNLLVVRMHWGAIGWLHEAVEYALYVGVFLAAPAILRKGAHIKADVISTHLPERAAKHLERLINLFGVGICIALCFYAVRSSIMEFQDQNYPPKDLRIANWYMMAVFAVSFMLCALEFLLALGRAPQGADAASDITEKASM